MTSTTNNTSGVIVAGGASSRLGHDKRALRLWGKYGPTLLEHTVSLLASRCAEVLVVLNDPESWFHLPARLVPDAFGQVGPLGGLASGLAAATCPHALVLAADMPFLNPSLLDYLLAHPRDGWDVLAPRSAGGFEPLHSIYATTCLPMLTAQLRAERRSILGCFPLLRVCTADPATVAALAPQGNPFQSINTPADLATFQ
jgi:molybdopterin-guanine dinucleotide biosynthesis protein A